MSGRETNFRAWVDKAEHDRLAIQSMLAAPRVPWDIVCFHAQQTAEKYLKAFLVCHLEPVHRTHDLVELLQCCVDLDGGLACLEDDCRRLTYYAVAARYPGDVPDPEEEQARANVTAAERVRAAIRQRLPLTHDGSDPTSRP